MNLHFLIVKLKKNINLVFFFFFFNIPIQAFVSFAQNNETPFSSIKAGVNLISVTNKNLLNRFWDFEHGYQLILESPFYAGNIQTGIIYIPYKGKFPEYPDFNEYFVFLGWSEDIFLPYKFILSGGIKIGYFIMNYDSDSLAVYQRNESEFSAGAGISLSYPVINNLYISAASDFTILFTSEYLKFYYISAGLSYKFNSPEWLRNFFN